MKSNSRPIRTYKFLIAACLVSLIISTIASYFFYMRWNEAEDRSILLANEKKMLEQDLGLVKNSFDKIFADMMVLRDENAQVITLHPVDSTTRHKARVYWNHYTRNVFIDVLSLPVPDSTKQYHLWARFRWQPIDAGVFNVDPEQEIQRVKPVANADAWLVTLEPKGSSGPPTPDQVFLVSKN